MKSTDVGYSFEHNGKLFFLFGDTNPTATFNGKPNEPPRRWDDNDGPIAFTTETNGEPCPRLDVVTDSIGAYKNPVVLNAQGQPAIELRIDEGGFCHFVHRAVTPSLPQCDNLSVPEELSMGGGDYGPYFISRFTTSDEARGTSTFYYPLSTWNPYQKIIMKATIARVE